MAGKITVKKAAPEEAVLKVDQKRPSQGRFRLQVDRQTKSTFESFDDAEKAGTGHQDGLSGGAGLRLYDAQDSVQTNLE